MNLIGQFFLVGSPNYLWVPAMETTYWMLGRADNGLVWKMNLDSAMVVRDMFWTLSAMLPWQLTDTNFITFIISQSAIIAIYENQA